MDGPSIGEGALMAERRFKLPDLGEGLEDAEVVRWLVSPGDEVGLNQPLIEVDTAKALVEIPSPVAGKVLELFAEQGATVKVGADLVSFEVPDVGQGAGTDTPGKRTAVLVGYGVEEGQATSRRRKLSGTRGPGRSGRRAEAEPAAATGGPQGAPASARDVPPPLRKLAAELGVDVSQVRGTGPGGRLTREDLIDAEAGRPAATDEDEQRIPVSGVRKLIAQKMARSWAEIPHVTTYLSVDASTLMTLRGELSSSSNVKVTPLAVVARALAGICEVHPKLNSTFSGDDIVLKNRVHMGIATDTERGLIVPVVRDAGTLTIPQMAEAIATATAAAREGRSAPDDLRGSTITISNVGSFGAEYGTPIINHPEAAILALGVIEERAVARADQVFSRPMATLSLSFDHRVLDGAEAGRALADLKTMLEDRTALDALC